MVINCARSKPFDLQATKDQTRIPIEVKPYTHTYFDKKNESQRKQHAKLSEEANFAYVIIQQMPPKNGTRGKVKVYFMFQGKEIKRESIPYIYDRVLTVLKGIILAT
ncbi:Uncharacterised protein [uncultured archaeon]|nr:Uncharacterised protein [uncultured archaeon]